MPDSVRNVLPYLTLATFALALLLFAISFRLFRRSRTDVFWRRRREAGQRGWRLFLLGAILFVASSLTCAATMMLTTFFSGGEKTPGATAIAGQPALPSPTPDDSAVELTDDLSASRTLAATPTLAPSPVPATPSPVVIIITATPAATPTPTTFPTFTPNELPLASSVTPLPNAQLVITALDDQISPDMTPVNPRATFDAGTTRIYLFVEFRGMTQGVLWRRELWRGEVLVDRSEYLWGLETQGSGYFFFGNDSGFEPGAYEIRLYLGDSAAPISVMPFSIAAQP